MIWVIDGAYTNSALASLRSRIGAAATSVAKARRAPCPTVMSAASGRVVGVPTAPASMPLRQSASVPITAITAAAVNTMTGPVATSGTDGRSGARRTARNKQVR